MKSLRMNGCNMRNKEVMETVRRLLEAVMKKYLQLDLQVGAQEKANFV
jgi:hypothetical protein